MLSATNYAQNYAGIIGKALSVTITVDVPKGKTTGID